MAGIRNVARRIAALAARRGSITACLVVALAVCALLSQALFSSRVLGADDLLLFQSPFAPALQPDAKPSNEFLYDSYYQMHPDMLVVRDAFRSGHLAAWSPYQGGGDALLASEQHAMLSPFNWLATVAPFWQSLEWLAAFKLFAAAIGLFLLLSALGLRRSAALLGGVAFAFCSPLIDWLSHPHANVYALLPWLLLAGEWLARRGTWRETFFLALVMAAVLLGGHPPSMVIVGSIAVPWFVYRLGAYSRHDGRPWRSTALIAARFAAGCLLGLAVSAVVTLPLMELSGQSTQIGRGAGGGPKSILFGFFAPDLWGRPDKFEIAGGPSNYLERTGYFGVLPILFAAAGFTRRPRGPQVFFAAAFVFALALVVRLPVLTDLFDGLPGVKDVNRFRYLVVCSMAGAALAAYGLDHLMGASRRRTLVALGAAALAAVLPLGWLVQHHEVLSSWRQALHHVVGIGHTELPRPILQLAVFMRWALFAAIGLAIVAVLAWRPRWAVALVALAIAVTAFDVVSYQRGFQPAIPERWADPPVPQAISLLQREAGHQRVGGHMELGPNVAERYALKDARIYRSPLLERRSRLWTALGGEGADYELLPPTAGRLANLYSVRYAVSYELQTDKTGQWRRMAVEPVVENKQAFPRAWLAYSWTPARSLDDALAKIGAHDSAADRATPVIEGAPPASGPPSAPGKATFVVDGQREVTIAVDAARPAQLILGDTWYPGWKARVDGRAATIRPANAAFRAVAVPAGRHTVKFSYESAAVRFGAIISAVAALILIAGLSIWLLPVRLMGDHS